MLYCFTNPKLNEGRFLAVQPKYGNFFVLSTSSQIALPHITVAFVGMPSHEKLVVMEKVLVHFLILHRIWTLIGLHQMLWALSVV
jgi:hypothetical protein